MTQPRHTLIDPLATPYYHCITRCVRRAFLCGQDAYSGRSFDHRKEWIVQRLAELSRLFCIDVCAYAVMSNHLHLVLRVDPGQAEALSNEELERRHGRLFPLMHRRMALLSAATRAERLKAFRARLADLSWFMRCLSESIARRANQEDGCKGRFWEGRFKSQALLDEAALLTCMSYVDLNPVRAGLAGSLDGSDFTSIQQRLRQVALASRAASEKSRNPSRVRLARFKDTRSGAGRQPLPFGFADYLALVAWSGRMLRRKRRGRLSGAMPSAQECLLARLGLDPEHWLSGVDQFHRHYFAACGSEEALRRHARRRGLGLARGALKARALYAAVA